MMVMCNNKHQSNNWGWIHGKVKQHWSWVENTEAATEVFCEGRCFYKFHKIYRKNPVPESLILIELQAWAL